MTYKPWLIKEFWSRQGCLRLDASWGMKHLYFIVATLGISVMEQTLCTSYTGRCIGSLHSLVACNQTRSIIYFINIATQKCGYLFVVLTLYFILIDVFCHGSICRVPNRAILRDIMPCCVLSHRVWHVWPKSSGLIDRIRPIWPYATSLAMAGCSHAMWHMFKFYVNLMSQGNLTNISDIPEPLG